MNGLIEQYERLRKYTIGKMQFPITYIIFGLIIVIYVIDKSIFDLLKKLNFLSEDLKEAVEILINFIYSNYLAILIILIFIIFMIMFIIDKTKLPSGTDEIFYTDGTTGRWSFSYAVRRLGKILILISTYWWVWSFILTVIFGGRSTISAIITVHPQISTTFDREFYLYMMILFYFNILVLTYYIIKSLFYGKYSTKRIFIEDKDIDMFICFNEKCDGAVKILKEKYSNSNNYYVVVDKGNSDGFQSSKNYNVILQTKDLEEANYLFDNIK